MHRGQSFHPSVLSCRPTTSNGPPARRCVRFQHQSNGRKKRAPPRPETAPASPASVQAGSGWSRGTWESLVYLPAVASLPLSAESCVCPCLGGIISCPSRGHFDGPWIFDFRRRQYVSRSGDVEFAIVSDMASWGYIHAGPFRL